MKLIIKAAAFSALLALAACGDGGNEAAQNVEAASDNQAAALENQADALEDQADNATGNAA